MFTVDDWKDPESVYEGRETNKPVREWIKEVVDNTVSQLDLAERKREVDGDQSIWQKHALEPTIQCIMRRHPNGGYQLDCLDALPQGVGYLRVWGADRETCEASMYRAYYYELVKGKVTTLEKAQDHAANVTFVVHEA